jgi:hypothetical protein
VWCMTHHIKHVAVWTLAGMTLITLILAQVMAEIPRDSLHRGQSEGRWLTTAQELKALRLDDQPRIVGDLMAQLPR